MNAPPLAATLRLLALLLLAVALCGAPAQAQDRDASFPRTSANASVSQTLGVTDVTITYGRPAARGRDLFGALEPFDAVWRTGANEATTITFSEPVAIEGQALAAGTYALFTIPGEDSWTIIFNKESAQWGAFGHKPEMDALRVTVTPEKAPHAELLTIGFDEATADAGRAFIQWGSTRVPFRITTDTQGIILARARAQAPEATDWRVPVQFANYAMNQDMALDEAINWIQHSIMLEENYNNVSMKAFLHAKLGQYAEAVAAGEKAVAMGQGMERAPRNLSALQEELATWREM